MLTKEQIKKVGVLGEQTGGFEGFYEPEFERKKSVPALIKRGNSVKIKIKLIYVELPNGDVVIQKRGK